jgi:hypothetical protein
MRSLTLLLVLSGCGLGSGSGDDTGYAPPVQLAVPDVSSLDLESTWTDALKLALTIDARSAWDAHKDGLELVTPGCPDLFYGTPDLDNDEIPDDVDGMAWADHCSTPGARTFAGYTFWQNAASVEGSVAALEGLTTTGNRNLYTNGLIAEGDAVISELDGTIGDSFLRIQTDSTERWTYNSRVDGTITGSASETHGTPAGGLRADLVLSYTGGDTKTLDDARGNIYFFEHRIADRFDSIAMDLAHAAPGNNANDCTEEPLGHISLRDENAFWYDLVFQPRYGTDDSGYTNEPYTECDGCGMIYIRGLEQGIEVCPDFSFLWDGNTLTTPAVEDFLLSSRDFD